MDPNAIRFARRFRSIGTFLAEAPPEGEPTVTPEQMTALVEMVLVNGPMPQVVLLERADGSTKVGRGGALLAACRAFANGAALVAPRFMPQWANLTLKDLPPWCQRRFRQRDVDLIHIEPGTPDDLAEAVMGALAQAC